MRDLITSITGSDLYVRDSASAAGTETNVTLPITKGMGAVRDLDVSPDGSKIVFSLRLPLNPNLKNTDPKQPNWKIYQYDAVAKTVTQLTNDDITAATTSVRTTCPTGESCSHRRASSRPRRYCSMKGARNTKR